MVWHQAIRVCFGNGRDIQLILLEEVPVVLRLAKHVFKPVGMVEDMITGIGLKGLHLSTIIKTQFLLLVLFQSRDVQSNN